MSIFLCYGNPEECQYCGGWTKAGGVDINGKPDGSPVGPCLADDRFCSMKCYDGAVEAGWVKIGIGTDEIRTNAYSP